MPIRMTGMMSGLDTETLIKSMVDAQKLKNKKTSDKSQILEWKQEKLKELNGKLYKLYAEDLTKLKFQSNYNSKKVTSSNENYVTVTGNSNAPVGTAEIKVKQTASSQTVIGGQLGSNVTGSTKLIELAGGTFTQNSEVIVTNGARESKITITENTTIDNFVSALKNAGLSANFDSTQKRIFVSSSNSGVENKFTITSNAAGASTSKDAIRDALGYSKMTTAQQKNVNDQLNIIANATDTADKANAITALNDMLSTSELDKKRADALKAAINEYKSEIKTEYINNYSSIGVSAYDTEFASAGATDELKDAAFKASDAYKRIETKIKTEANAPTDETEILNLAKARYQEELAVKKIISDKYDADASIVDADGKTKVEIAAEKAKAEFESLQATNKATYDTVTEQKYATGQKDVGTDTVVLKSYKELASEKALAAENELAENAVDAADTKWSREISTLLNTLNNDITNFANASNKGDINVLSSIGLGTITGVNMGVSDTDKMSVTAASDAEILYNGVSIKSSSNTIAVNGFNITLKGNPPSGETITLSSSTDSESTVKAVKEFVKKYNELVKEMNELYYAKSAREYAPLSDDEREAMTESQIEKWEEKIKDSMLRRDDSISTVLSSLKSITSISVTASDGKKYSLASLGIGTSKEYTEKGLLHIDGDSEDAAYALLTDKLTKMLQEQPDVANEILAKTFSSLYDTIDKNIKSIPNVRSAFTFYNDKTMNDQQTTYKKKITELDKKLVNIENKYYKQFAAMETALAKLQEQQSQLSGFFGSGQ